jgi:hypothetical protein
MLDERRKMMELICHQSAYMVHHLLLNAARSKMQDRNEDTIDTVISYLERSNKALHGQRIEPRYQRSEGRITYVQL